MIRDFDNGIQHSIPISSTVPMGNFTWTNTLNFKERWYFQSVEKYWDGEYVINPFGRQIKCDQFRALNFIIQSTTSDIFLRLTAGVPFSVKM